MRDHCPFCDRVWYENAKPCAGVLIEDESGRVLLARRSIEPFKGLWDVPGGHLEADEDPETGAKREVREELGLEVALQGLLGIWVDRFDQGEDPTAWHRSLNLFYRAKVVGGSLKANPSEVHEPTWFPADRLPPMAEVAYDNAQRALLAWQVAPRFGV